MTAYWCADHVELPYVSDRLAKQAFLHNLKIERQQKALRLKMKTESLKEEKKKAKKKVIHTKNADSDSGHISDDEVRFIKIIRFTEKYIIFVVFF